MIRPFLYSAIVLFIPFLQIFAQISSDANPLDFQRPGWIVVRGSCTASNITPEEAQRRAIEQARRTAIEQVAGAGIRAMSLVDAGVLRGDITESVTRGVVAKDTLLDVGVDTYRKEGARLLTTEYYVSLACSVVTVETDNKSTLQVKVELDKQTYISGESGVLTVKATEDCYLHVFNLWADGSLGLLFPNSYIKSVRLKAGETFRVPDVNDPILSNLELSFATMPGEPENTEYIKVIATKTNRPFLFGVEEEVLEEIQLSPDADIYTIPNPETAREEFFRWFLSLPPEETAVGQVEYMVVEK